MNTRTLSWRAALAAGTAALLLAGCGGGGDSSSVNSDPLAGPPAEASQSSGDFIAWVKALAATADDQREPASIDALTPPADDTGEPAAAG